MNSLLDYSSLSNPADSESLGVILSQCFNPSASAWSAYSQLIGLENYRIIRQAGQVIGDLAILSMGQWYGSRCVPVAGIAAVLSVSQGRGEVTR